MLRFALILSCLVVLAAAGRAAEYHVSARYPVGGDASRWDYLRVDPATRYLYVAHFTKFEVLNADTGRKLGEIAPASRAHGVVIVPGLNRGFATSGNDNAVIMFDPVTLKTLAVIKTTGTNPDAIQYDATDTGKVYAVNGSSGNVTVIDPATAAVTGNVKLSEGKLEQICFDGRGRAFVNNEDKGCVHVFDTHTLRPVATWPAAPGEGGTGLDIDPGHHRLYSACGNDKLVVFDSDTGRVVATPAIGADPDGVVFDVKTGRIFTSNADGTMTILHEDTPDQYSLVQTVATGTGAKQLALDPATSRIFVPTGRFQASAQKLPPVVPGSFEILVVSPVNTP